MLRKRAGTIHIRKSKQKTQWLGKNPTKSMNRFLKIKYQIWCALWVCVFQNGRRKGVRREVRGREQERRQRKKENGRLEGRKEAKDNRNHA